MNKQIMILIASCLLTFSHFCFSGGIDLNSQSRRSSHQIIPDEELDDEDVRYASDDIEAGRLPTLNREQEEEKKDNNSEAAETISDNITQQADPLLLEEEEGSSTAQLLDKGKDKIDDDEELPEHIVYPFAKPGTVPVHKTLKQVLLKRKTIALALSVGAFIGLLYWFFKDPSIVLENLASSKGLALTGGLVVAGGVAAYSGSQIYQDYKEPILRREDMEYIKNLLKEIGKYDLSQLASKYFNIQDISQLSGQEIHQYSVQIKQLLKLIATGMIAAEASDTVMTLYTTLNNTNGYAISDLNSITQFINQCKEISCSNDRAFGFSIPRLKVPNEVTLLFPYLEKLTIKGAEKIRTEVSELQHLTYLKVTESPQSINYITDALWNCAALKQVLLQNNKISDQTIEEETFSDLPNIELIDLSHNKLTKIPANIPALTTLTHLDISYNKLKTLPATLTQLTSTQMHFEHNRLNRSTIPATLRALPNIQM